MKKDNVTFEIDGVLVVLIIVTIIAVAGIITSYYKEKNQQIVECVRISKSIEQCKELLK